MDFRYEFWLILSQKFITRKLSKFVSFAFLIFSHDFIGLLCMYTFVDLSFTGTTPRHSRIVSVALANYEGKEISKSWTCLLNPKLDLSPLEAAFLHIDPMLVHSAPLFAEVAEHILAFTEGRILVGLQIRQLYGLLLGEFRHTTYRFQRRQICLTKLINEHFGVRQARSVTAVCDHFNIPFSTTYPPLERLSSLVAIFEHLFLSNTHSSDKKYIRQVAINSKFPPQLLPDRVELLPNAIGVYYFMGKRGEILYLGKSTDIKKRVKSHFNSDVRLGGKPSLTAQVFDIQYRLTGSELIALLLESDEIKRFMPAFNRAQRRAKYSHAVYMYEAENGYLCLIPAILQPEELLSEKKWHLIQKFTTQWSAVNWIFHAVRQYSLHLDFCGVASFRALIEQLGYTPEDFDTPLDAPKSYNERVQMLIAHYSYPHSDMLIIDKGRSPDERSVVVITYNKYVGYAYLPKENAGDWQAVMEMLIPFRKNPDVRRIIQTYLRKQSKLLKIIVKT